MPDPVDPRRVSELPLDELVACHECDLLMRKPHLALGEKAQCPRCGYELYAHRYKVVERSLALVIAALLLYIPANFLPIMQLNLLGQSSEDTVWSGVVGLFDTGMQGVAAVVFLSLKVANLTPTSARESYVLYADFDNIGGLKPKAGLTCLYRPAATLPPCGAVHSTGSPSGSSVLIAQANCRSSFLTMSPPRQMCWLITAIGNLSIRQVPPGCIPIQALA